MWFAAEILPVVGVDTLRFVVLLVVGTPLGFEIKHVETLLSWHFVDQRSFYINFGVRKRAVLLVFA